MKKILITIVAMLSICMEGIAQISGMELSYCDGHYTANSKYKSSKSKEWISAAIYIPAGMLNTFAGNNIDSIRVGLASKLNVDTLKVWLRTDLNGDNLAESTITKQTQPKILKGWNAIALDKPYAITSGDKGLYIGYSFYQKGASGAISALSIPTPNGLWLKMPDEQWTDRSAEGVLSIEGLVYGDKLPKINLALKSLSVQPVFVIDKGKLKITGQVKNLATQTITGFDVVAKIDGIDKNYSVHVDSTVAYRQEKFFTVTVNPDIKQVGQDKVTVTLNNLNEGADEDPSDNTLTEAFTVVQHDFTRKVLVEEFTTEKCTNCPRMANWIHTGLEKDAFKDNVIVACHHSGYYTDWLTQSCDNSYLWFYNKGGQTYAPAIMVDRFNWGGSTPVISPESQQGMENYWQSRLDAAAFVAVNVTADVVPGTPEKVQVTVSGSKTMEKICDNPRLVVYLLEDNIPAQDQAGAAASYIQNHVKRAYNSTWGDPIEWNGDDYTYTCEFELSEKWKKENLQVVAFIYNYDENDAANCVVANAGAMRFKDLSSIQDVDAQEVNNAETEYFNLSGERVVESNLSKGIYIVKKGNHTQKIVLGK